MLPQGEPISGDVELTDLRVVRAAAGLQDGDGPFDFGVAAQELEEHDVVREMGNAVLGKAGDPEQFLPLLESS